jgi:hypothetical protein
MHLEFLNAWRGKEQTGQEVPDDQMNGHHPVVLLTHSRWSHNCLSPPTSETLTRLYQGTEQRQNTARAHKKLT